MAGLPVAARLGLKPRYIVTGLILISLLACGGAKAQIGVPGAGIGGPGLIDTPKAADGQTITQVTIETTSKPGANTNVKAVTEKAQQAFGFSPGSRFDPILADVALGRVRTVPGISDASYRLQQSIDPEELALVLRVTLGLGSEHPTGVLTGGGPGALPILYQDNRSLLRVIINTGSGVFSDGNPWLGQPAAFTKGSPLVRNPAVGANTGPRATWAEGYVEYGLGGATQIGETPFYVYGAATGITPLVVGQDIFRNDTRVTTSVEKLYAGMLYVPPDSSLRVNISVGRQNFTLNEGFLIAQYGSQWNAGPRPGVYLAPRTTQDFAALSTIKWNRWVLQSFYLNPNELELVNSDTRLVGSNLRLNATKSIYGDITALYVPHSNTLYPVPNAPPLRREGLITLAGHIRWADATVAPGVWLESELAHQSNVNFPMSAWGGYGTVGYLARGLPWTPSISYRYSEFTGDNPNDSQYGRFDTLYSGGLSEWLQGITSNKVLSQSNRIVHRVRLNVSPTAGTNLTLDWYLYRANQLNNLGANRALSQLSSHDLGQEWQFAARCALSRGFYFLGIASVALPGEAARAAAGGPTRPWSSLQAQLFWSL